MARTFRCKRERHKHDWVQPDWDSGLPYGRWVLLDQRSKAERKAMAHFHFDKAVTMKGSQPREYRKVSDHQFRTRNERVLTALRREAA